MTLEMCVSDCEKDGYLYQLARYPPYRTVIPLDMRQPQTEILVGVEIVTAAPKQILVTPYAPGID